MGTHRLIPLLSGGGGVVGYAKVDACDYSHLNQWIWRLNTDGYACRRYRSSSAGRTKCGKYNKLIKVTMHGEVACRVGLPQSKEVDHKNRVKLDNRRSNLRSATRLQQMWNIPRHANNKSGALGVSQQKSTQKWIAQIATKGKNRYLGSFDNLADAVAARNKAVLERDPEFAVLSEVPA